MASAGKKFVILDPLTRQVLEEADMFKAYSSSEWVWASPVGEPELQRAEFCVVFFE